jgi:hypothetical protein
MDLDKIKSVIIEQLNTTDKLTSLKLQNHIYGCFVIMEDIAQNTVTTSGTIIEYPASSFDFDKQFSTIGLRYGFVSDTLLTLDRVSDTYKNMWMECFSTIDLLQDISVVDEIEDVLISSINSIIDKDNAYFTAALDTGVLPDEWVIKLVELIELSEVDSSNIAKENTPLIEKATIEKPIKKLSHTRKNGNRRSTPVIRKRLLNITRRK